MANEILNFETIVTFHIFGSKINYAYIRIALILTDLSIYLDRLYHQQGKMYNVKCQLERKRYYRQLDWYKSIT